MRCLVTESDCNYTKLLSSVRRVQCVVMKSSIILWLGPDCSEGRVGVTSLLSTLLAGEATSSARELHSLHKMLCARARGARGDAAG